MTKKSYWFVICLATLTAYFACTPKVTEQTQTSETTNTGGIPLVSDDPCAKFEDSRKGSEAEDAHVIYRDFLRHKDYDSALPYWRVAMQYAPAADGNRQTHYDDGVKFYDRMIENATSQVDKETYLDSVLYIYDRLEECYGDGGYVDGRKGWDLYYKHRALVNNDARIIDHFKQSLDTDGLESKAFVVNPFTALLVEGFKEELISQDEAVRYARQVLDLTTKHVDDEEDGWPIVVNYAPTRLEVFETVKGFYDCDYYVEKYFEDVDLTSVDCEEIFLIRSRLRWGGCDTKGTAFEALDREYNRRCVTTPPAAGPLRKAKDALENGEYQNAIDSYKEYIENTEDPKRKAKYTLRIAKIYYAHLKDFRKSREFAREAMKHDPTWGEPLIVIGKLYASSGPLCGPGRGWDSQIVTWPAIDKFQQAKRVDPSVSAEANKWIAYYRKYMPSVEDIFQRQLSENQSFRVGCWIQENTTIRAAKK